MRRPAATLVTIALVIICSTVTAGQPPQGVVRGEAIDRSGGVLPGVTVVAAATDGRLLATTVTDGSGRYVFPALPAGPITLSFQLEGFATATVGVAVRPGAESRVVERLELASLSETVVVKAPLKIDPPLRLVPPPPPPPPPPPVVRPVPAHDRSSICGPAKPDALPESLGIIRSGRDETQRGLYTTGSQLVIDAGLDDSLEVGRNLVVRRHYHVRGVSGTDTVGEHSAGLVQIVAAAERSSIAVVVYACDELRTGDFLAAFKPQPHRNPDPLGMPVYDDAARILLADEGQTLGVARRLMVIDRGDDHGIHVGQRFTLFRQGGDRARREVVGDAVVVAVRTDSATIRVDRASDVITPGDWAAPQSASSVGRP
jgi:Carboxypeptidase regulatory-like domain